MGAGTHVRRVENCCCSSGRVKGFITGNLISWLFVPLFPRYILTRGLPSLFSAFVLSNKLYYVNVEVGPQERSKSGRWSLRVRAGVVVCAWWVDEEIWRAFIGWCEEERKTGKEREQK